MNDARNYWLDSSSSVAHYSRCNYQSSIVTEYTMILFLGCGFTQDPPGKLSPKFCCRRTCRSFISSASPLGGRTEKRARKAAFERVTSSWPARKMDIFIKHASGLFHQTSLTFHSFSFSFNLSRWLLHKHKQISHNRQIHFCTTFFFISCFILLMQNCNHVRSEMTVSQIVPKRQKKLIRRVSKVCVESMPVAT